MRERLFLGVLSSAMAAGLALFLADPQPAGNPATKAAFEKVVEQALDSNAPTRFELWHAAQEQITRLDPNRPAASSAFVRAGFFHWYELNATDRRSVILAIEPLLHDGAFFDTMAQPLYQLTGDFTILRRANPGTEGVLWKLGSMAVVNGHFDDYRFFREQLRRRRMLTLQATRTSATPAELIALVPIPSTAADKPLLQGILDELHDRSIDNGKADPANTSELIDFALDHDMQPLDGLEPAMQIAGAAGDPQRARLALRLGDLERAADIESESRVSDQAQWHRYYVERAVAEMRRHESLRALQYLQKAGERTADAIAVAEEMQRAVGNRAEAAAVHATLVARANRIEQWFGKCGDDVCNDARGSLWSEGQPFTLKLATVQSDEVPPYVELYTDDALAAEGPVSPSLVARAELLRGIHRIDLRLANPMTRNAIHRRIRIE
jgi:hypothetical protein